ncbi:hypothetical protein MBLNU13_g02202t1 [Cladosporium sp. NU13]
MSADNYHMLEELGSGSFGIVYRALDKRTGQSVAVKHIDLEGSDDDIREIQQEISLLSTCHSPYVTNYLDSFVRGVKLWIVMEYLGGGSCLDLIKPGPMEERYIAIILRELLQGLDYLHSTGKIHRDIKAANILLSEDGDVKIADFGVAAQLTNIKSQRLTFVGTPFWMAPEVIQEAGYDFHADIWSLGITAMELALGEPPRSDIHPMKVLFLIPKEKAPRLEGNQYSRELKDFVSLCLQKEPEKRPTAKSLLKHSFIRRAGKTEALQELVQKAKAFENGGTRERDVRYYEETLRDVNLEDVEDEWVFSTIRPSASIRQQPHARNTLRRPRLDRIPSGDGSEDGATVALENMSLRSAPLGDFSSTPGDSTPTREPSTIRTPKVRSNSARKISQATTRKVSVTSPTARRVSNRQASGSTPTARRVSGQPKQPLGLDMSFGNSASTVRMFKRVSSSDDSGHSKPPSSHGYIDSPQDSIFDVDSENRPPPQKQYLHSSPVVAATKESILGRRTYAKCIEPALQEAQATTADRTKREALSRVAESWSRLDELDPEGELLLLKAMLERISNDPKVAAALLPQLLNRSQSPSKKPSLVSSTTSTLVNADSADILSTSSPSKFPSSRRNSELPSSRRNSELPGLGKYQQQHTPISSSPPKQPYSHSREPSSPSKLVMNPQNPHLKRMRSSQPEVPIVTPEREKGLPGGKQEPGMEHVGFVAEALYGRWAEGLRGRWGMMG